jgi:predicted metal-binding protein
MKVSRRSYPVPWRGRILLACQKCQKKLKKHADVESLGRLKKVVKHHNSGCPENAGLHVVNVPCMKLCPKGGVVVCVSQVAEPRLVILRRAEDLDSLSLL